MPEFLRVAGGDYIGAWPNWIRHLVLIQEIAGSSPVVPTKTEVFMKLVLHAAVQKTPLEFFRTNVNFQLQEMVSGEEYNILVNGKYTGIFFRDGELCLEAHLTDDEEDQGLLETPLIQEILRQTELINSGNLGELESLADNILLLERFR